MAPLVLITISWPSSSDSSSNGLGSWRLGAALETLLSGPRPRGPLVVDAAALHAAGLSPDTQYMYRVSAVNATGAGVPSNVSKLLVINKEIRQGRFTIVFVKEPVGF